MIYIVCCCASLLAGLIIVGLHVTHRLYWHSRHERCLRHIADLEIALGLNELPWHYTRVVLHGRYGEEDEYGYLKAKDEDIVAQWEKKRRLDSDKYICSVCHHEANSLKAHMASGHRGVK